MKWEDYKTEFECDDGLRDIYVLETSVSDWQILVDFFRSGVYEYSCSIGGEEAVLPISVKEMFDGEYEFRPLLAVKAGAVILNCHFFIEEEIEFDLDPCEITNEFHAEQVFAFMRQVGQVLNKEVILTPESYQSYIIFKFSPSIGQIKYIPCEA